MKSARANEPRSTCPCSARRGAGIWRLGLGAAAVALLAAGQTAWADKNWKQAAGNTTWATGSNWDEGTAPANDYTATGEIAIFNKASYTQQPNAGTTGIKGISVGGSSAALTISSTVLTIGASGVTVANGAAALTLNASGSGNVTLGDNQTWVNNSANLVTINRTLTLGSYALTFDGTGNFTHSSAGGNITGTGGSLVLAGTFTGTLTLARTGNNFTGGVTIRGGTVSSTAGDANAYGSGTITVGHTAANANPAVVLLSSAQNYGNAITVTSASQTKRVVANGVNANIRASSMNYTIEGDVSFETSTSSFTLGLGDTGAGTWTGAGKITVAGPGIIAIGGGQSSFSSAFDVTGGTLKLNSGSGPFTANNVMAVGSGGKFDINSGNATVAGLNDISGAGGIITNSSTSARTLTLGGSGSYSFSGKIQPDAANPSRIALTTSGSGTHELKGASTYTGNTSVGGTSTLLVNSPGSLAATAVTVGSGATFGGTGAAGGNVTYNSGGLAKFYKTTGSADTPLAVTGTLTFNSTVVTVEVLGSPLGNGTYTIATATSIPNSPNSTPTITGQGLGTGGSASLAVVGGNTLQMTVTGVIGGSAPAATNDVATTAEDTPITINVTTNDAGFDVPIDSVVTGAWGSALSIDSGTNVIYTPAANSNGVETFQYVLSNAYGKATGTVSVTVSAVNDPPVANDDSMNVQQDELGTNYVLVNDTDVENDTLQITAVTQGTNGGTVAYTASYVTYSNSAAGADSFTYEVSDGNGGLATGTVNVTVTSASAPPLAGNDTGATLEDTPVTNQVTLNDSGFDPPIDSVVTGAWGSALSIDSGTNVIYTPAANSNGVETFQYVITNAYGSATGTVTMTVTAVNDAPSFTGGANQTTNEDCGAQTVSGWATGMDDGDPEASQTLAFVVTNDNNGLFSVQPAVDAASGDLTYTPAANSNGTATVTVTLTDDGGSANGGVSNSAPQPFTITVNAVNDPPVAGNDSANVYALETVVISVLTNDTDVENDTLTVTNVTQGANGSVTFTGTTVTYSNASGSADTFSYMIGDGNGGSATGTVNVTVVPVALYAWTGTVSTAWATAGNWTNNAAPPDDLTGGIAEFKYATYANQPQISGTRSVRGIAVGAGSGALTISGASTPQLRIGGGGITVAAGAGKVTVSSPITVAAAQTWTVDSVNTQLVSGAVAFDNALSIDGSGTVTLSAAGSGAGGLAINQGTVNLNNATAAGTGVIVLGGGAGSVALWTGGGALNPTNNLEVNAQSGGTVTIGSNGQSGNQNVTYSGSVTLNGPVTLTDGDASTSYSVTFSGAFSGSSTVTVSSAAGGLVRLNGNTTPGQFTSPIEVTGGTLEPNATTGLQSNAIAVGAGAAFTFGNNSFTIAGLNDVGGAGGTVQTTSGSTRTLTLGGSGAYAFSGSIGSTYLALATSGAGTHTLSGTNTYGGATTVGGTSTLIVNGTNSGSGAVAVSAGATLGGSGRIAGNTTYSSGAKALFYKTTGSADTPLRFDGTLALNASSNNPVTVEILGSALGNGSYVLATAAPITGGVTNTPSFTGFGHSGTNATLAISGGTNIVLTITGAPDFTDPNWVSPFPDVNPTNSTGFTIRGQIDEVGAAFYVVLTNAAPAPSSAQVTNATDGVGSPALTSGSFALAAYVTGQAVVSGLSPSTDYDVYVVAQDIASPPNLQDSPAKLDVTTLPPDTTPPGWVAPWPYLQPTNSGGFTVRAKLDEPGTAYYVVLTNEAPAPGTNQVKNGQDAGGNPALKTGSISLPTANIEGTANVSGLNPSTAYDVYLLAEDASTNLQGTTVKLDVTTLPPSNELYDDASAGDWSAPSSWTNNSGYPQAGDAVKKDTAVTIAVTSDQEFGGTGAAASAFSAGTLHIGSGRKLTHLAGSTNGFSGTFVFAGAGTFENAGLWDHTAAVSMNGGDAGFTFVNGGTYRYPVSGGGGTPRFYLDSAGEEFRNTGLLVKTGGTANSWSVLGAAGGGVFRNVGGTVRSDADILYLDNETNGPAWVIDGGSLVTTGNGKIAFSGKWSLISAAAVGSGVSFKNNAGNSAEDLWADSAGLTLNVSGDGLVADVTPSRTAGVRMNGAAVTNNGVLKTLIGNGPLKFYGTATPNLLVNNGQIHAQELGVALGDGAALQVAARNAASGYLYLTNSSGASKDLLTINSGSSLTNFGTIVKQGSNQAVIRATSGTFVNEGVIRVEQGELNFAGTFTALTLSSAGRFVFELEDAATADEKVTFGMNVAVNGFVDIMDNGMDENTWYTVISTTGTLTDNGIAMGTLSSANRRAVLRVVTGANGHVDVYVRPVGTVMQFR